MAKYAADTTVGSEQSRIEIERVLRRYGAEQFMSGWGPSNAIIGFRVHGRMYRISLPIPDRHSDEIVYARVNQSDYVSQRSRASQETTYEKAIRQRWRALLLIVKAKLEAVDAGIVTLEEEFLAHAMLPDGQTVQEWIEPQVAQAYETGQMPESLPGLPLPSQRGLPVGAKR